MLPSEQNGFYLKYSDEAKQVWLSLEDPGKLTEVVECADEWYASVGLFLPKEKAWLAIKEFCQTGNRTDEITWIDPAEESPKARIREPGIGYLGQGGRPLVLARSPAISHEELTLRSASPAVPSSCSSSQQPGRTSCSN